MFLSFLGDKDAFPREEVAKLYRRTGALVLRRCRLILRDDAEAEDVLQEVFVRVMRYGRWENEKAVPLSWLYRTAERCCFNRQKKNKREPIYDFQRQIEPLIVHKGGTENETALILTRFLNRLEPKLKQLVILYYVDGMTQDQVAEELGWTRRTVGRKLKQIAERVKRWA